ncbi:hypothetical protein BJ742DRAFT_777560 [Cladochytrium replicatum]|nr:hypothetical protein BJ742DRAFT_777560 [Cladochytrium replicatum]
MQPPDVPTVATLLNAYLAHTTVARSSPRRTWCTGCSRSVVSSYSLPSSVINHPKHKQVRTVYMFYYAPKESWSDKDLITLVKDTLILG